MTSLPFLALVRTDFGTAMKLDKAAATRLLRQPLKDAQSPSASSNASRPSHSGHDIGVNSRFNAVTYHDQASDKAKAKASERNAFQSQHSDSDSDSDPDPDLEVFNGSTSLASHTPTSSSAQSLHRPTEPSVASDPKTESRGKRKRTKSHNTSSSGPPTAGQTIFLPLHDLPCSLKSLLNMSASGDQPGAKRRRKRKNKTGKTTQ